MLTCFLAVCHGSRLCSREKVHLVVRTCFVKILPKTETLYLIQISQRKMISVVSCITKEFKRKTFYPILLCLNCFSFRNKNKVSGLFWKWVFIFHCLVLGMKITGFEFNLQIKPAYSLESLSSWLHYNVSLLSSFV